MRLRNALIAGFLAGALAACGQSAPASPEYDGPAFREFNLELSSGRVLHCVWVYEPVDLYGNNRDYTAVAGLDCEGW